MEILLKHFKPNELKQLISHHERHLDGRNIFHWIRLRARVTNAENENESERVMQYMSTITKNISNQRVLDELLAHQDKV